MSKSLKKLIDINRLREFKNKLVGAGSAYVQTAAVDQTIAGTKTFSKPIVGSVTGSSGSCTGNAATATKATQDSAGQQIDTTYIKGLAVSGRTITYTKGDGTTGTITTQDTNTDTKVTQTVTTTNTEYPVLFSADANKTATSTTTVRFSSNIKINPSTNTITATTFKGNLTGNVTGNASTAATAATATNATYANWLRTSSHSDHLFHTEWDNAGYFWTYVTTGNGDYRAVRVARSDSAATAQACTGNAATATKATQDAAGNTITTTYATKAENNTKANNSEVVHKSGDETIAGTKTFNDNVHASGFHATDSNALIAQRDGYTLVLRNDGDNTYLLMSDKGGVPGTWSSARPLVISNSRGVCDINGNAATATKLDTARTIALSGAVTGTATGFDGSGNITIPVTALSPSAIRAQWYAAYPDGPEAHNAMWGGRDITAAFNNGTVSANIANGTFRDIFPGDYITKSVTISGTAYTVNWVVADCDYWINKGDQGDGMTTHHVAIVPQQPIFAARMNSANTTEGGYKGSEMFKNVIPACATGIVNAFGSSHILTFRDHLTRDLNTSAVSSGITVWTGAPNWNGEWVSVQCNLMSEAMVYDGPHCASSALDNIMATRQMSAFRLSEKLINYNRQAWWLRDVVSSADFAAVHGNGAASAGHASYGVGVRPFALLK